MQRRRWLCGGIVALAWALSTADPARAAFGVPDVVPAGTLVVPMIEANPLGSQDTLIVVNSVSAVPILIHLEFWDVNGVRIPSLAFNTTLAPFDVFPLGTAVFLAGASPDVKAQLTDPIDGFLRGFVTIDAVTEAPTGAPTDPGYPLLNANVLEGWIYYVRLFDGSSNGIPALAVQATGVTDIPDEGNFLEGFYTTTDDREELDEGARLCNDARIFGQACLQDAVDGVVNVDVRIFTEAALNGTTRAILFAWEPGGTPPNANASFTRFSETGAVVGTGNLPLTRVVNVWPFVGEPNGWATVLAPVGQEKELFSFTFNAANPDVSRNWDAVFTNPITP